MVRLAGLRSEDAVFHWRAQQEEDLHRQLNTVVPHGRLVETEGEEDPVEIH